MVEPIHPPAVHELLAADAEELLRRLGALGEGAFLANQLRRELQLLTRVISFDLHSNLSIRLYHDRIADPAVAVGLALLGMGAA